MNRLTAVAIATMLLVSCAKKADDNAGTVADTSAQMAAAAKPLTLGDVAGTWKVEVSLAHNDSIVNAHTLWATADTTGWKMLFDGRSDTIPVRVLGIAGDSVMTVFGPYSSALRKDVKVVTNHNFHVQGNSLTGNLVAHYSVTTADSVVQLRSRGTRQ
jgi:hypothetical protein